MIINGIKVNVPKETEPAILKALTTKEVIINEHCLADLWNKRKLLEISIKSAVEEMYDINPLMFTTLEEYHDSKWGKGWRENNPVKKEKKKTGSLFGKW